MKKMLTPVLAFLLTCCVVFSSAPVSAAGYKIDFTLNSEAALLVNLDTDTVVFDQNADKKMEPASTTKIMTFIIASEQIKDLSGTKITAKKSVLDQLEGTGSSLSGVLEGEELTALQLLNCLMVPSGNDAAMVLADYVGGGDISKFVDLMNAKAKELGLKNTHFANPHGLHDPNHYTTARDLYTITRYAMTLPYFTEITSQTRYELPATNKYPKPRTLVTTNYLTDRYTGGNYFYKYAKGIKTGSHDQAGYCLVSTAIRDGYSYMAVALHAPKIDAQGKSITTRGEMIDTKKLYEWAFSNLQIKTVVENGASLGETKLDYAWNKDKLLLVAEKSYATILPKDVSASSVLITPKLPKSVEAPVKKGQVVGTAVLSYANQDLTTINLVAAESVERSELLHSADVVKKIVTSVWFLLIAGIIVALVIVYLVLALLYNKKRKRLRKVKKYRDM